MNSPLDIFKLKPAISSSLTVASLFLSATALINAGDSKAAPVFCYLSNLASCSFTDPTGTFTANSFTITPSTGWNGPVPPFPLDYVTIDVMNGALQINTAFAPNKSFPAGATLKYNASTIGLPFQQAFTTSSVAGIPPISGGTTNVTSTLTGLPNPLVSINAMVDSGLFTVPVQSTMVSSVFTTGGTGNIGNFVITLTPGSPVANNVPGPLPILGAGAAFGFSRRMRRRINTSTTA
jgi:hypothetical protein